MASTGLRRAIEEAIARMVVHNAHRLQIGVKNCRAYEAETSFLEVFGNPVTQLGPRRNTAGGGRAVDQRPPVHESPEVGGERAEFALHLQKGLRVGDGGVD